MSYYTLQCDADVPHGDFVKVIANLPVVIDPATETVYQPLPMIAVGLMNEVVKYLVLKRADFLAKTVYTLSDPNCLGVLEVHPTGLTSVTLVTDLSTIATPIENRVRRNGVAASVAPPVKEPEAEGPSGLPWLCILERAADINSMIAVAHDLFTLGPALPNRVGSADDIAKGVTLKSGSCLPSPLIMWVPKGLKLRVLEALRKSFEGTPTKVYAPILKPGMVFPDSYKDSIVVTSSIPTLNPYSDFGLVTLRECKQFPIRAFFKNAAQQGVSRGPLWRVERDGKRLTLQHGLWKAHLIPKDINVKGQMLFSEKGPKLFSNTAYTLNVATQGRVRSSRVENVVITPHLQCLTLPDVTYTYTTFWDKVRTCISMGLPDNAQFLLDFNSVIQQSSTTRRSNYCPPMF